MKVMREKDLTNNQFYIMFGVLTICLIFGIFFDLDISKAVCNEDSIFAMFFASFLALPLMCVSGFTIACSIKLSSRKELNKRQKIFMWIATSVIFLDNAIQSYIAFNTKYNGLIRYNISPVILTIIVAIVTGTSFFITYKKFNTDKYFLIYKILLICGITCGLEFIIITILKEIWTRPRYRLILNGGDGYTVDELFRSMFEIGKGPAGDIFTDVDSDYFKSFPSGHSSTSYIGLLSFYFPFVNKHSSRKSHHIFFGIFCVYGILTQYSRIVQGAHFLTDVSFGSLICLITHFITANLIFASKKLKH